MADNNATGVTTLRKGSALEFFSHKATGPGTAAGTLTPIVINATPMIPVFYEAQLWIETASGGTSPTVGIGTTTAGTNLIGLTASTAAGFFPASNAVAKGVATDVTPIYIIEGGTPNGAGVFHVMIRAATLNLNPTN